MLKHGKQKAHLRTEIDVLILNYKGEPHYFMEKCAFDYIDFDLLNFNYEF